MKGTSAELWCQSDASWEWCRWIHHDRFCDYEWMTSSPAIAIGGGGGGVERTSCDFPEGKVELIGNYDNNECGIRINDLELTDRGLWLCEIEKYYIGFSRRSVN